MRIHRLGGGAPTWELNLHHRAEAELLELPEQLQCKFRRAFETLEADPLTPRPGTDIAKLVDVPSGSMYRMRVGPGRACYALVTGERRIWVLVIERRGAGYDRIIATAIARSAILSG